MAIYIKCNEAGMDLIRTSEGLSLKAYFCPAGKRTIGYGHVLLPEERFREVTKQYAELLLISDIAKAEAAINRHLTCMLTSNQHSALVSWVFNFGEGNLKNSSLLKLLNLRQFDLAAMEFLKWVYSKKEIEERGEKKVIKVVLPGLVRRRQKEKELFLKP